MVSQQQIQELHAHYATLTGLEIPLTLHLQGLWGLYVLKGYGMSDLEILVRFLKIGILRQERRGGCLRLSNWFTDWDLFAEEMAMARKHFRPKPAYAPQKAQVLRATGRHDEPPSPPAEQAGAVIERLKLAAMLNQWKASNL